MVKISLLERQKIIVLHEEGYSQRQIVQKTKYSRTAIRAIIKKFKNTGSLEDKTRSGRPPKLTKHDIKYLKNLSLRNRKKTSSELAQDVQAGTGTSVSSSCIRRHLLKAGLRGCVAIRKPLLRRGNKEKRLKYAKQYNHWTQEMLNRVLYTDESKFELFGSKNRQYVRRRVGEAYHLDCLHPTIKHGGGSVLVWGCISSSGVGDLIRIDGKLTGERYVKILRRNAIPSGMRLIGNNFILQQDNDPKHCSRVAKKYLQDMCEEGVLEVMNWPPQSPDLNIIEHVWEYLNKKKVEYNPRNAEQCFQILKREWDNIPQNFITNLYKSIPRRIAAVIKAKGGHTKY